MLSVNFKRSIFIIFSFLLSGLLWGFTLGAVQWKVSEERYSSPERFEKAVIHWLDQSDSADFVIFPEYTSVFASFFFSHSIDIDSVKENSQEVRNYLDHFWGGQAAQRGIWILAGTYLEESHGNLYNTALIYGPRGTLFMQQRKCFLGSPEKQYGLSAGAVEEVEPFRIKDRSFALTICRDSYNEIWETHFPPVDLWIDIKANELPYTEEYYRGALPSRLMHSQTPFGFTLSLTGDLLGYHFEGSSEWRNPYGVILKSYDINEETLLLIPLEGS